MKLEEKFELNYKKWIHTGDCIPQVAASLILGIDPDVAVDQGALLDIK